MRNKVSAVIVGIDGSKAAIRAAEWAVEEAFSRSVPLVLIAVIKTTHPSAEDYHRDIEQAETSLRAAQVAIKAIGRPVKVETEIQRGQSAAILISESAHAEMICVGSVGIDRYTRALIGSTATEVAENSHCPVAVIRWRPDHPRQDIDWVVVTGNDAPDRDIVLDQALREAQLRKLPVLAIGSTPEDAAPSTLDDRLQPWRRWYPEVHIYGVTTDADVANFLEDNDDWVPLAVIGGADAGQLAQIVGAHSHSAFRRAEASVLIVREN